MLCLAKKLSVLRVLLSHIMWYLSSSLTSPEDPEFHLHVGGLLNPIPGSRNTRKAISLRYLCWCKWCMAVLFHQHFSLCVCTFAASVILCCHCLWVRLSVWAVWAWWADPFQSGGGRIQIEAWPSCRLHLDYTSPNQQQGRACDIRSSQNQNPYMTHHAFILFTVTSCTTAEFSEHIT